MLNVLTYSHGYRTDYDEIEDEEETDFSGGILQDLMDYGDISGMVEASDKVKMGLQFKEMIKRIEEKGYFLFAEYNFERIKYSKLRNW